MGVPKFFRWISERYPCLSELITEHQVPEFDYLYLDMNGIIHICSHPDDDNVHFRITEEDIFNHVSHYISFLFRIIKPRKCFFMAVDGVAPRAKMNQQRGRRFKSAKLAEEQEQNAIKKGEKLPDTKRFDSNCITPGTPFMARLHAFLKYFVVKKISEDPLWQRTEIILSGHETPGEGEHKIQDYIRYIKSKKNFDPNSRHCLYGLDADLIMLGLVSHEPHFALLREEVKYTKQAKSNKRAFVPEEQKFFLLHLSLLREYLNYEFSELETSLSFKYDLECIIDDWIMMGCLVGNDFIPHLPNLHIHSDALPLLWRTYKEVLPSLDGYINEGGKLNIKRFIAYIRHLAKFDLEYFAQQSADSKWMMGKQGAKLGLALERLGQENHPSESSETVELNGNKEELDEEEEDGLTSFFGGEENVNESLYSVPKSSRRKLKARHHGGEDDDSGLEVFRFSEAPASDCYLEFQDSDKSSELSDGSVDVDDEEYSENDLMKTEYQMQKRDYYLSKLHIHLNKEELEKQAVEYIRALQWILYYYYRGVPSWSWFYPQHYAPYVSDLTHFPEPDSAELTFDYSSPFLPFEQLMAVLPALSREFLPEAFRDLMVNSNSPLIDFYPQHFQTDLNGKKQEWEALVLIPFIDEERMLSVIRPLYSQLTNEERQRNHHGPHLHFRYSKQNVAKYPGISNWDGSHPPQDIKSNHAIITELKTDHFVVPRDKLVLRLLPGANLKHYHVGFPTFRHLQHSIKLEKIGVKVFEMSSRNESIVLQLVDRPEPNTDTVARQILQKPLYVNWPHFTEVFVVKVCDNKHKYYLEQSTTSGQNHNNKSKIIKAPLSEKEMTNLQGEVSRLVDFYKTRRGIEVGKTDLLLYGLPACGQRYKTVGRDGKVRLEKQWAQYNSLQSFLYQCSVEDISISGSKHRVSTRISEVFPVDSLVFSLGQHYGCMGVVDKKVDHSGKISVKLSTMVEPDLSRVVHMKEKLEGYYYPGFELARQLDVNSHFLSRITGSLFLQKTNSSELEDAADNDDGKQTSKKSNTHNKDFRLNIGLNLKFNRRNEEVPGWTRRSVIQPVHDNFGDQRGASWEYSDKILNILVDYREKFPEVFKYIRENTSNDIYVDSQIFPKDTSERVKALEKFLGNLPCHGAQRLKQGHAVLCEEILKELEKEIDGHKSVNKTLHATFKPDQLFMTMQSQGNLIPDPSTETRLFDRIVNVRPGFSVPLGFRGTVIGVLGTAIEDTVYEVLFDQTFEGAITLRGSTRRCYRLPAYAIINFTHEDRRMGRVPSKKLGPRNNQTYYRNDSHSYSWFNNYHAVPPPVCHVTQVDVLAPKYGPDKKSKTKKQSKQGKQEESSANEVNDVIKILARNQSTDMSSLPSDSVKLSNLPGSYLPQDTSLDSSVTQDLTDNLKNVILGNSDKVPALPSLPGAYPSDEQNQCASFRTSDCMKPQDDPSVLAVQPFCPQTPTDAVSVQLHSIAGNQLSDAPPFKLSVTEQRNSNADDLSRAASALNCLNFRNPPPVSLHSLMEDPAIITSQNVQEQVFSQTSEQQSNHLLSLLQKNSSTHQSFNVGIAGPPQPTMVSQSIPNLGTLMPPQSNPNMSNLIMPSSGSQPNPNVGNMAPSPSHSDQVPPSHLAIQEFCARTGSNFHKFRVETLGPNVFICQLEMQNPNLICKGSPQANPEDARMSAVDNLLTQFKLFMEKNQIPRVPPQAPRHPGIPMQGYPLPPYQHFGFQQFAPGMFPLPVNTAPVLFQPNPCPPQTLFCPPPMTMPQPCGPPPQPDRAPPPYSGANHRPFLPPELAHNPFASDFYDSKSYLKYPDRLQPRYSTLTERQFSTEKPTVTSNQPVDLGVSSPSSSVLFIPPQVARKQTPIKSSHNDSNGITTAPPQFTHCQETASPVWTPGEQIPANSIFQKPHQQVNKTKRSRIAARFNDVHS